MDAAVLRQLFAYLRRLAHLNVLEPCWRVLPTESAIVPHHPTERDTVKMMGFYKTLGRPPFRSSL
jgi:hypothetical protein